MQRHDKAQKDIIMPCHKLAFKGLAVFEKEASWALILRLRWFPGCSVHVL